MVENKEDEIMGYRSDVGIATTKEVYDRLMEEAPEYIGVILTNLKR